MPTGKQRRLHARGQEVLKMVLHRGVGLGVAWLAALVGLGAGAAPFRSIQVDPGFPYYQQRSPESIAAEIRANGYGDVRLVCTSESGINAGLVKALARAGLRVWFLTFANGTYSTADLPAGWQAWKMRLRTDQEVAGYHYLCPNNPDYRLWKKRAVTEALRAHREFSGVDLAEAFLPAYQGPESPLYGCLCARCTAAFCRQYPRFPGPPEFSDPASPAFWRTDGERYRAWVEFRVQSVVAFLDDLVNGPGGIRERCPGVKVATWSMGLDVPQASARLREWEALDGPAIVRTVCPDVHVIQTDWPDWSQAALPADYPLRYREIVQAIRAAAPAVPLLLQADIGSQPQMRRSREWLAGVEAAAREIGCLGATHYEYHLGRYIYDQPPTLREAHWEGASIRLTFDKRLGTCARHFRHYAVAGRRLTRVTVDGNVVYLRVTGRPARVVVTVKGLCDDRGRRFFHDLPAAIMPAAVKITVPVP